MAGGLAAGLGVSKELTLKKGETANSQVPFGSGYSGNGTDFPC